MKKYRLMSPGPTPVPEAARLAMAKEVIHHRTPQFKAVMKRVCEKLKKVVLTENPVYVLTATGTGAMEASVTNLLSRGEKAVFINGGKFGERFGKICESYGVDAIEYDLEWGKAADPARLEEILASSGDVKAVYATLCETSTGVNNDIKALGEVCSSAGCALVVDAISGLGADEFRADEWGVDVFVGGSQKGLMLPPGLAFISLSDKARDMMNSSDIPTYYFDLKAAHKSYQQDTTPWTSAVSLVEGLDTVLDMMLEEGMDNVLARHARLAEGTRRAIKAMGLELFAERPSSAVTSVKVPEEVDGTKLVGLMRDDERINIAGGQAELKGRIFRLAHLGYMDEYDIIAALAALDKVLEKLGYAVKRGQGVIAAQVYFSND